MISMQARYGGKAIPYVNLSTLQSSHYRWGGRRVSLLLVLLDEVLPLEQFKVFREEKSSLLICERQMLSAYRSEKAVGGDRKFAASFSTWPVPYPCPVLCLVFQTSTLFSFSRAFIRATCYKL